MRPAFSIVNKGQDLAGQYAPILEELSLIDSTTEQADCISIRLSDIGNTIALPKKGELITVAIGEDGNLTKAGLYVIDGVEIKGPPDTICLTGSACPFANAETLTAMQTRRTRSWDNITIGALVAGIAGKQGLSPAVSSEFANEEIPHLDQTAESNMNLLTRIARTYGAIFKPTFGKLVFTRGGEGKALDGSAIGTLEVTRGPGMRWEALFSKRSDFAGSKASCHDLDKGETIDATAGMDAESAKIYRETKMESSPKQAKAKAWSRFRELKRGSQIVTLDLPGFYEVASEQKVSLSGFRAEMNGIWIAKRITFVITRAAGLRDRKSVV